jgi:hypothetical protein
MRAVSKKVVTNSVLIGFLAGIGLLSIYFFVVSIANSFSHAVDEFLRIGWWIAALVIGFSVQVGFYFYIREVIKIKRLVGATSSVSAAGGISTTSMIACCAHHITDVLPIIGLSAASIFLNEYQKVFLLIGVLSNLVGIVIMLKIMQSNNLYDENGLLRPLFKVNMRAVLLVVTPVSILLVVLKFMRVF